MDGVITFENDLANDNVPVDADLFDDDPFNLPPPLPALDEADRDQDGGPLGNVGDANTKDGEPAEKKKRKVNRSPRLKLDEARLCSDRGLPALLHLCDNVKFKGRGHEASDLKLLLQNFEHWAHRLFPKFPFDAVVEQVEHLGGKKLVQNTLKSLRRGEDGLVRDNMTVDDENPNNDVQSLVPQPTLDQNEVVSMTPDVQERIRLNREKALAKRRAAMEATARRESEQTNSSIPEQTEEYMTEQMEGHMAGQTEEQVTGQTEEHMIGMEEYVTGQTEKDVTEQAEEDVTGQTEKHVTEQTEEHVKGQTEEQVTGQTGEHVTEEHMIGTEEHVMEQAEEDVTGQTEKHLTEQTEDYLEGQAKEQEHGIWFHEREE